MKKILTFVILGIFTLTGCDNKWIPGASSETPTPTPLVLPVITPTPAPQKKQDNSCTTCIPLPPNTVLGKAPEMAMETVWQPFKLPSRERPGMWKEVFVKVEIPYKTDLNTRNYYIAKHAENLRRLGKCVEDYIPLSRSGPRQVR